MGVPAFTRRRFGSVVAALVGLAVGAGCQRGGQTSAAPRLRVRVGAARTTAAAGTRRLSTRGSRGGVLHVPLGADAGSVPLVVLFHGAGGNGATIFETVKALAETSRVAVLAPDSLDRTWDALMLEPRDLFDIAGGAQRFRGFGPDVAALDDTLEQVFKTVAVDAERVIAAGFSDGATYALSLALANGTLLRRAIAFSPGFIVNAERAGRPDIFVSHGRGDRVLPIDRCSRRIVPHLNAAGYSVDYREFDGGHEIPEQILRDAIAWGIR